MAQGVYHTFNIAKKRVLKALYDVYPNTLTSKQISQITGMEYGNTRRLMSHYANSHPVHYIRRLKIKKGKAFRYKINKSGVRYLFEYTKRVKLGIGLNLKKNKIVYLESYTGHKSVAIKNEKDLVITPEQLLPYIKLTRHGEHDLGIKHEDKLKIVGLVRDEDKEEVLDDSLETLDEKKAKGKEKDKVASILKPSKKPSEPKVKKAKDKPSTQPEKLAKLSSERQVKEAGKVYFVPEVVANRLVPFFNKPTVPDLPEMPETRLEPAVMKSRDKPSSKKEKPLKSSVKKVKESGKESNVYVVLDLPELDYPEKIYTGQSGKSATSLDMAINTVYGLNELDKQMRRTLDKNNLKKLEDKRRKLFFFLKVNPDVSQFVDVKQ